MSHASPTSRIVVLISGGGSIMQALIEACEDPQFGGRVVGVIADRESAGGLELAADAGIATAVVGLGDFPDRDTWNRAVAQALAAFKPDLVVLAGFMKILGEPSLTQFGGRIINTHPALLPSFPGAHGVRDALEAGVKVTGCSVIVVDAGVDSGPILAQAAVDVWDNDTEETLHERIKVVERTLVVETVGRMVRHGWHVDGNIARVGAPKEGTL